MPPLLLPGATSGGGGVRVIGLGPAAPPTVLLLWSGIGRTGEGKLRTDFAREGTVRGNHAGFDFNLL